jgi:hypothetical protein
MIRNFVRYRVRIRAAMLRRRLGNVLEIQDVEGALLSDDRKHAMLNGVYKDDFIANGGKNQRFELWQFREQLLGQRLQVLQRAHGNLCANFR